VTNDESKDLNDVHGNKHNDVNHFMTTRNYKDDANGNDDVHGWTNKISLNFLAISPCFFFFFHFPAPVLWNCHYHQFFIIVIMIIWVRAVRRCSQTNCPEISFLTVLLIQTFIYNKTIVNSYQCTKPHECSALT